MYTRKARRPFLEHRTAGRALALVSQILDHAQHARRENITAHRQDARQLGAQETQTLPYCNAPFQKKGADLIDDAGTLADQALADAVQSLQVKLVGGLGRNELHGGALHRLGDRLSIAEVVLLSLAIRPHVFGWHQSGIVAESL